MAIEQLKHVVGEASSLSAYALCSLFGNWIRPDHHRWGHRRPVVLVPGFLGRALAFTRLKWALARRGHPVYVAEFGWGVGCIEKKARQLEAFIDDRDLDDFYAVGHSMGGTISLAMSDPMRRRVHHFITLGTSFHGAVLGYLLPMFPAARQVNPDSELLDRIVQRARDHDNLTNIIPRWDEIALPMKSCRVTGCRQVTSIPGHVQVITRSEAFEQLHQILDEIEDEAVNKGTGN